MDKYFILYIKQNFHFQDTSWFEEKTSNLKKIAAILWRQFKKADAVL